MATADFELNMTINGTNEELATMLAVFKKYIEGEDGVYFNWPSVTRSGEEIDLEESTPEEILEFLEGSEGEVEINAGGPYGHYGMLNDVDLFRDMAEAAPDASLEAEITGTTTYTEQNLNCNLENRILHISTFFEANEEEGDVYAEYFTGKLPYEKFIRLFQVTDEDFDEDVYADFITDTFQYEETTLADMDYDAFMKALEVESDLDEEGFEAVMKEIRAMGWQNFYEVREDAELGFDDEMDYDPIAKAYVGRPAPMKCGVVYSANETIRAGLDAMGLPSDDAAIAALSVEEAYAALAAGCGQDDGEDFDDEDDWDEDDED